MAVQRQNTQMRRSTSKEQTLRTEPVGGMKSFNLIEKTLYKFIQGVNRTPEKMSNEETRSLKDPMATTFFANGLFPLTIDEVMNGLDELGAVPNVNSYLIGEGGQIHPVADGALRRDFRFAIIRSFGSEADLMVSTDARDRSVNTFLQVAAWDAHEKYYNFYMRMEEAWVWCGNSYTALEPESRGKGCFDSHVNGSVVMKELEAPWMHWQSMSARVILEANDPIRTNPLFQPPILTGAEDLETKIKGAIFRWTHSRLSKDVNEQRIAHPQWLVRQMLTTTTVNIATSPVEFENIEDDASFPIPVGFWINHEALLDCLHINANFEIPTMKGKNYKDLIEKYRFALKSGTFTQKGDSFFAFAVPVPAFEDVNVVDQMVNMNFIGAKFAACCLMVDFPNPIYSNRRQQLMKYCPPDNLPFDSPNSIEDFMAKAIMESALNLPNNSAEAEFASRWRIDDSEWPTSFGNEITKYIQSIQARILTADGADEYVQLAESRRRDFKRTKLHEFGLTLPETSIAMDAPALEMCYDGKIHPRT